MNDLGQAFVVQTNRVEDLALVTQPQVPAVVYTPPDPPPWMEELAAAVAAREFEITRTILDDVRVGEVEAAVEHALSAGHGRDDLKRAVLDDVVELVDKVRSLTGASSFTIGIFTGDPNLRCGYHVDTVPPRSPTVGLLRVYNGAGTSYVAPGDITDMRDFYRYLSRRERLVRDLAEARDEAEAEELRDALGRLDREPPFVEGEVRPNVAPAGSIVMFEHLDAGEHWSGGGSSPPWIHCSPMGGGPRLVVNVAPRAGRLLRDPARATGATSR